MSIFDREDKARKKQICSTILNTNGDFFHKENMPKKFTNLNTKTTNQSHLTNRETSQPDAELNLVLPQEIMDLVRDLKKDEKGAERSNSSRLANSLNLSDNDDSLSYEVISSTGSELATSVAVEMMGVCPPISKKRGILFE